MYFLDVQLVGVHAVIVLGIGDCALEELLHRLAGRLGGIHDDGHRFARILAADQIADQLDLTRGHAHVAYDCSCFHVSLTPPYLPLLEVLLPA